MNLAALDELARQTQNTMFGLYDMFSGGNLSQVTIFALGIMPYISASIILQLLTVVWPYLEKLSKEGELGRRKITQYTRYGTIVLSVVQALGIAIFLERQTQIAGGLPLVYNPGSAFRLMTVLTLTTGTCFIMWLGEQITERGIGNGMSLIIYVGHRRRPAARGAADVRADADRPDRADPDAVPDRADGAGRRGDRLRRARPPARHRAVRQARRRPADVRRLEHAHPAEGEHRRRHPGDLRLVDPGVPGDDRPGVPGQVARSDRARSSASGCRSTTCSTWPASSSSRTSTPRSSSIPDDVAENMRKYGGFVPGIRPGKRTAEYIDTILTRITLAGAIYLALIAMLPNFLISGFKVAPIPFIGDWLDAALPKFITEGMNVQFFFGGTSLLIVVGVAMDTVQQVESQLIMRHYDGFMKKTRIRGRRA